MDNMMLFKNYQISCFFAVLEFFAVCDHHLLKINLNQLITPSLAAHVNLAMYACAFPVFTHFFQVMLSISNFF